MKKKISLMLAALIFTAHTSAFGAISDITINADGILQPVRNEIINRNGNNLVGLREISDILGADDVFWDSKARTVTIKKDSKKVMLSVDTKKAFVDGKEISSDVSAEIVNDRVMVPLRFISEIFDAEVSWNQEKKQITVNTNNDDEYIVLDVKENPDENTKVYTYEEALLAAQNKNSSLKNLDDSISYLTEARDELSNNLRLANGAYESYLTIENGAASGGISDSTSLQLKVSESLSSTIKIMQSMKSTQVNKELKDVNAEMIKDGVAATLKNYITSIKTSLMNISLLEENVKLGQENIENLELKLSVGMESEQNVSTAKLEQKQLESNLESAKLALENLKHNLCELIGEDSAEDVIVNYNISFDKMDNVDLDSYIALKTKNDPSIKTLKANVDIAEYNYRVGSVNATDSERINLANTMNTEKRKLSDAQDNMKTNIKNAYNNIKQLEEQNKAKKAAVQEAIETYNSVVVSYQAGMATSYQVSQAKMGILNAEKEVEENALNYDLLVFTFERPYMLGSAS